MKYHMVTALLCALLVAALYASFAFVAAELDSTRWLIEWRAFMALLAGLGIAGVIGLRETANNRLTTA